MTAHDYKTKLLGMRDSRHTPRAADCWIDQQIAELEAEKNTRRGGQVSGLRNRLRFLVASILTQLVGVGKG